MASVSDLIVREYFEHLGYVVRQPCKHVVPGRQKKADEEVDLLVQNPTVMHHKMPAKKGLWGTGDLAGIARAVVCVRGWHTERFYASTFKQSPEILAFARKETMNHAARLMGTSLLAKVICLPRLPAGRALREDALRVIVESGVDGVITFETMLSDLINMVDVKKHYEKSDLLQVLRVLKNYKFLKDPQMDLFEKRLQRPRRKVARDVSAV